MHNILISKTITKLLCYVNLEIMRKKPVDSDVKNYVSLCAKYIKLTINPHKY